MTPDGTVHRLEIGRLAAAPPGIVRTWNFVVLVQKVIVSGVALAGLDRVSFGVLDGDAVDAESIASDRFAEDVFAFLTGSRRCPRQRRVG